MQKQSEIRTNLAPYNGKRQLYRAVYSNMGNKRTRNCLVQNVVHVDTGEEVASHAWIQDAENFDAVSDLRRGDEVEFLATAMCYKKHRGELVGFVIDWALHLPTAIRIVTPGRERQKPLKPGIVGFV
jgi:hypothetical protein